MNTVEELEKETRRRVAKVDRTINSLFLAGLLAVVIGCYEAWHPLGWIAGGVVLVAFAAVISNQAAKVNKQT